MNGIAVLEKPQELSRVLDISFFFNLLDALEVQRRETRRPKSIDAVRAGQYLVQASIMSVLATVLAYDLISSKKFDDPANQPLLSRMKGP